MTYNLNDYTQQNQVHGFEDAILIVYRKCKEEPFKYGCLDTRLKELLGKYSRLEIAIGINEDKIEDFNNLAWPIIKDFYNIRDGI